MIDDCNIHANEKVNIGTILTMIITVDIFGMGMMMVAGLDVGLVCGGTW